MSSAAATAHSTPAAGKAAAPAASSPSIGAVNPALLKSIASRLIPSLSSSKHKGQSGKIGVVGGCREYTGAPYYVAISAMRTGADLVSVFCTADAATPLKCYSPELMVHPLLVTESEEKSKPPANPKSFIDVQLLRLTCLAIGSGLGRDDTAINRFTTGLLTQLPLNYPCIVDGDALFVASDSGASGSSGVRVTDHLLYGRTGSVCTPNAMEFRRLWKSVWPDHTAPPPMSIAYDQLKLDAATTALLASVTNDHTANPPAPGSASPVAASTETFAAPDTTHGRGGVLNCRHPWAVHTSILARRLGGVTIIRKGAVDIISNGTHAMYACGGGCPRRCGGQGDVLAGIAAAFRAWVRTGGTAGDSKSDTKTAKSSESATGTATATATATDVAVPDVILAGFAACLVMRDCGTRAFAQHKRSTVASDLVPHIGDVMESYFPVSESLSRL